MIEIYLHGKLKKFGDCFKFNALDVADALRLLFAQRADIKKAIHDSKFTLKVDDLEIDEAEIHRIHNATKSIHILPVVAGRGGVGKIVTGAVLIGAAFLTGGASMALWSFGSSMMFAGGVALMMMGASSLFFKPPKIGDMKSQEQGKSAHFGNLGNNIAHNAVYPICYGTFYCGSVRVSEGVIAVRNNPKEKPKNPIAGQIEAFDREYFKGTAGRDPLGNLYPTDFNNDSVKARNYKVV